jgi:hypothetical protein
MKKWEYRITRYHLKDFVREEESARTAFHCDPRGQCSLHDLSRDAGDRVLDALNEEGQDGWELVQWGTHQDELMCLWKRALD